LISNAGEGVGVYSLSEDGIDTHFQVNHLAQMMLGFVLLPVLEKSQGRLVVQSSQFHHMTRSSDKFESIQEIKTDIGPSYLYNRSRLAQVLFVRELWKQLAEKGGHVGKVYVNATHPA
jgi:WW domain-containing oxidoreductase